MLGWSQKCSVALKLLFFFVLFQVLARIQLASYVSIYNSVSSQYNTVSISFQLKVIISQHFRLLYFINNLLFRNCVRDYSLHTHKKKNFYSEGKCLESGTYHNMSVVHYAIRLLLTQVQHKMWSSQVYKQPLKAKRTVYIQQVMLGRSGFRC